jgi:hypothetical protein
MKDVITGSAGSSTRSAAGSPAHTSVGIVGAGSHGTAGKPAAERRRALCVAALAASMVLAPLPPLRAQEKEEKAPANPAGIAEQPNKVRGDEITPQQKRAVERGLAWLAARQAQDGSFNTGMHGYSNHAGITSLAGLAFMQAGNLPRRGKYGSEVQPA